MRTVRLSTASVNQTPMDWLGNERRLAEAIEMAQNDGSDLVVTPELGVSGYGLEDMFQSPDVLKRSLEVVQRLAEVTKRSETSVVVGLPLLVGKSVYNAAAMLSQGIVVGFTLKQFLAGDSVHYEPRFFKAWPAGKKDFVHVGTETIPVGDLYYDLGWAKVGLEICEDAWVARRRGAALAHLCDVIANPSASHFAMGKHTVREDLVKDASRRYGVAYVYSNLLGNEAGRVVYDGGGLVASRGRLILSAGRLSYAERHVHSVNCDLDSSSSGYRKTYGDTATEEGVSSPFLVECRRMSAPSRPPLPAPPLAKSLTREEEFTRAASLGLFDYMRKARASGYTLSLSGGADSSAVAVIADLSWRLCEKEIGRDGLAKKLIYSKSLCTAALSGTLPSAFLTTAYQATENSSKATRESAAALATSLGSRHFELDIEALNRAYRNMIEHATREDLSWRAADGDAQKDAALQNLQARVRVPGIWLLANLKNSLLLTTGNRSEIAVGYTTMDGDSSGSFNPIGGVPKHFIRYWLTYMEKTGIEGFSYPALAPVNALSPSAELRPLEKVQTDEEDLMPYDLLDEIEAQLAIEKRSPEEVYQILLPKWKESISEDRLQLYVERFFRLWARNQWKRERFAPSLHLDDRNLDPRSWMRFPILSGGYEGEIDSLKKMLKKGDKETDK